MGVLFAGGLLVLSAEWDRSLLTSSAWLHALPRTAIVPNHPPPHPDYRAAHPRALMQAFERAGQQRLQVCMGRCRTVPAAPLLLPAAPQARSKDLPKYHPHTHRLTHLHTHAPADECAMGLIMNLQGN